MYNDEDTPGILLIDADNAFNRINSKVSPYDTGNTSVACPELYKYLVSMALSMGDSVRCASYERSTIYGCISGYEHQIIDFFDFFV